MKIWLLNRVRFKNENDSTCRLITTAYAKWFSWFLTNDFVMSHWTSSIKEICGSKTCVTTIVN